MKKEIIGVKNEPLKNSSANHQRSPVITMTRSSASPELIESSFGSDPYYVDASDYTDKEEKPKRKRGKARVKKTPKPKKQYQPEPEVNPPYCKYFFKGEVCGALKGPGWRRCILPDNKQHSICNRCCFYNLELQKREKESKRVNSIYKLINYTE